MENLRNALNELQSKTIGIAKIYDAVELVISETEFSFVTVLIGSLGGLHENHYPKTEFKFVRVPEEHDNLAVLLREPLEFYNWYKEFQNN